MPMKVTSSTNIRSEALISQQQTSSNKTLCAVRPGDYSPSTGSEMSEASSVSTSSLTASPADVTQRISYITDPEGDAGYFDRFVELSKILKFESVTPNFDDTLPLEFFPYTKHVVLLDSTHTCDNPDDASTIIDETMLVCGGDVWDKGGGDLYITRQLLSMQNRYGEDRVHFIIGNRDVNKIRILQEIGSGDEHFMGESMPHHHGVYWLQGTGLQGDPDLINILASERESPSIKSLRSSHGTVPDTAAERLTWILVHTMGCPDAFELRRGELKREKISCARALINAANKSEINSSEIDSDNEFEFIVTDDEVVQSYRLSCHPTKGVMGQYLSKGKLALRLGSVLFLHGCLPVSQETLMAYKAYKAESKSFLDNLSIQVKSKSEDNSSFWAKFYRNAMPWLSADNNNMHSLRNPHDIQGSTLKVIVTKDSNRSIFSDISDSYNWPPTHSVNGNGPENFMDDGAGCVRRSTPEKKTLCYKMFGCMFRGKMNSVEMRTLLYNVFTCGCKCRVRQIQNKKNKRKSKASGNKINRRERNKPEHMNIDGIGWIIDSNQNIDGISNNRDYEEPSRRVSIVSGSDRNVRGDEGTERDNRRISFSKYEEKVKTINDLRTSLTSPDEHQIRNEDENKDKNQDRTRLSKSGRQVSFTACTLRSASLKNIVQSDEKQKYARRHTFANTISLIDEEKMLVEEEEEKTVHNVDEWIDRLNKFSKKQVEAWGQYVTDNPNGDYCWSRYGGYDDFGGLIQLGMGWLPNKEVNHSIVYSTWITDGMPPIVCGKSELDCLHAELMGEFCSASGLDLIVTGHQPIGDSPLTIQVQSKDNRKPKYIIVGDTSYSGDTKWIGKTKNMGRGKALSARGDVAITEILIDQCAQGAVVGVTYHGKLSDGLEYTSNNFYNSQQDSSLVGKLVNKNLIIEGTEDDNEVDLIDWIVKAHLSDGSFLIQSGKGHQVFNARATKLACAV